MENQNELKHYGIIGMRWGVRRARNSLEKAKQLRKQGRKKEATKLETKAKKRLTKHERLAGKKTIDYTMSQSLGKSVAKSLLLGTYGALRYDQMRSEDINRGLSAAVGVLGSVANYNTMGVASIVNPRIRADLNDKYGR